MIVNCFVKFNYVKTNEEGSDVTEIDRSVVDYITDWVQLGGKHCWRVLTPMCLWTRSSRCGVLYAGEMRGKVGSGTYTKERQGGCRDSSCAKDSGKSIKDASIFGFSKYIHINATFFISNKPPTSTVFPYK
jgi:hypothetical protein